MARVAQIPFGAEEGPQPTRQEIQRLQLAQALMQEGSSSAPVQTPMEGLGRTAKAWAGALMDKREQAELEERRKAYGDDMAAILQGASAKPWVNPDTGQQMGQAGGLAGALATAPNLQTPEARASLVQLQLAQALNPPEAARPMSVSPGSRLVDPVTGQEIYSAPEKPDYNQPVIMGPDGPMPNPAWIEARRAANPEPARLSASASAGAPQDPFLGKLAEKEAGNFSTMIEMGGKAARNLAQLNQLEELVKKVPTGATAAFKQIAGNFGIQTEGLDDIQALQALVNQLVPSQRPPGSGQMSDADLELFKQSLVRMINQPGGNLKIISTMRAINEYDRRLGEIASKAASGEITRAQAREQINKLGNPIDGFLGRGSQAVDADGWTFEEVR